MYIYTYVYIYIYIYMYSRTPLQHTGVPNLSIEVIITKVRTTNVLEYLSTGVPNPSTKVRFVWYVYCLCV